MEFDFIIDWLHTKFSATIRITENYDSKLVLKKLPVLLCIITCLLVVEVLIPDFALSAHPEYIQNSIIYLTAILDLIHLINHIVSSSLRGFTYALHFIIISNCLVLNIVAPTK